MMAVEDFGKHFWKKARRAAIYQGLLREICWIWANYHKIFSRSLGNAPDGVAA